MKGRRSVNQRLRWYAFLLLAIILIGILLLGWRRLILRLCNGEQVAGDGKEQLAIAHDEWNTHLKNNADLVLEAVLRESSVRIRNRDDPPGEVVVTCIEVARILRGCARSNIIMVLDVPCPPDVWPRCERPRFTRGRIYRLYLKEDMDISEKTGETIYRNHVVPEEM